MDEPHVLHMPPPRTPRRRFPRAVLGLLLATLPCIALGAALFWFYNGKSTMPQGVLEGTRLPIIAPLTAQVSEFLVTDGQYVHAGQPLARLDNAAYRRQETEARALVRHALPHRPDMGETARRVAAAQAAEEYTVRRVALARHEEEDKRLLLEQRVMEHVQAELRLRNLDARSGGHAPETPRAAAVRGETQARQKKDLAKAEYEAASRTRAAVEAELRRTRQEVENARTARSPSPSAGEDATVAAVADPTVLSTPADGRVVGVLAAGQQVQRGASVLYLIPAAQHELWASVNVAPRQAAALRPGQFCQLRPAALQDATLTGEVHTVPPLPTDDTNAATVPVRIRLLPPEAPLPPLAPELLASLPGRAVQITVWTRDIPGLRACTPLLSRLLERASP